MIYITRIFEITKTVAESDFINDLLLLEEEEQVEVKVVDTIKPIVTMTEEVLYVLENTLIDNETMRHIGRLSNYSKDMLLDVYNELD